jgi:hypothetical protein
MNLQYIYTYVSELLDAIKKRNSAKRRGTFSRLAHGSRRTGPAASVFTSYRVHKGKSKRFLTTVSLAGFTYLFRICPSPNIFKGFVCVWSTLTDLPKKKQLTD